MSKKQELKQKLFSIMQSKFAKADDISALDKKFDLVLSKLQTKWDSQIVKNLNIPSEIVFTGLKEELKDVFDDIKRGLELRESGEPMPVELKTKPEWWQEPTKEMVITEMPQVEIKNVVKSDNTDVVIALGEFFTQMVSFFTRSLGKVFSVVLPKEHYLTPQFVMLVDPKTGKPLDPRDIGLGTMQNLSIQNAGGPSSVAIRGANAVSDGSLSVTTAGTRVQFPSQHCAKVYVQAHPDNTGDVVIGGSTVVADASTRRGLALSPTQWQPFDVDNLNRLYIDGTVSGDKINYIYEYNA